MPIASTRVNRTCELLARCSRRNRGQLLTPIPHESSAISRIFVTLELWTISTNAQILRITDDIVVATSLQRLEREHSMEAHIARFETARASKQAPTRSTFRAFIAGAACLFNIFAVRAKPTKQRTPEDDVRNLHGDLEKIGQDFSQVLSRITPASDK
jgi:hypothetical protein